MPIYEYHARSKAGAPVKGTIEAEDEMAAKRQVRENDLIVVRVAIVTPTLSKQVEAFFNSNFTSKGKASLEDLLIFSRQLQTVYSVGIPILHGLNMIREQTESVFFKNIILVLCKKLEQGQSLSEAMADEPEVFDRVYINLIKTGEASGKLEETLGLLCYFNEQKADHVAKVKSALFYPKMVFAVITIVMVVLITFVIPKMATFYDKFGGQLPWVTLVVIGFSNFVTHYWYLILAVGAAAFFVGRNFLKLPATQQMIDRIIFKLPVFGILMIELDTLVLATVLEMMIKSGQSLNFSLDVAKDTLRSSILRNETQKLKERIESGVLMQDALRESKHFPKMFTGFVSVGSEGGKLDAVLNRVGNHFRVQVEYKLSNLSKAIEPILLAFIFAVVLFVALSVFLPIWKMSSLIKTAK